MSENDNSEFNQNQELLEQIAFLRKRAEESENFISSANDKLHTIGYKTKDYRPLTKFDYDTMTSKERSAAKKRAISIETEIDSFRQAVFGMIVDMKIKEKGVKNQDILSFLDACNRNKMIDMRKLVSTKEGNIRTFVPDKHKPMFDMFHKYGLFRYSPNRTSGSIGPAEIALSMLGSPSSKAGRGDLMIDRILYEVKAGTAGSGGRLNASNMQKATTVWCNWSPKINQIARNAPADANFLYTIKKDGTRVKQAATEFNGDYWNISANSVKYANRYNFNPKGLNAIRDELVPYSTRALTKDLFQSALENIFIDAELDGLDQMLTDAISDDGDFDPKNIEVIFAFFMFENYKMVDAFDKMIVIDHSKLDFLVMEEATDFAKAIIDGKLRQAAGFNWNDDQQSPSPSYLPNLS